MEITNFDKAIVGGILAFVAWYLGQKGIELPADVSGALETVLNWFFPIVAGLLSGVAVYHTRNKPKWRIVPDKEQPADEVLPYRNPPGK